MKRQSGFTLLEVLIAGVILFAAIASASLIYSSSVDNSVRATRSVRMSGVVMGLVENIKQELRATSGLRELSGEGEQAGVGYSWRAEVIEQSKPVAVFSKEDEGFTQLNKKIFLWRVDLNLSLQEKTELYQFVVSGWEA
ncbi:hypothetical protein HMF8227_00712 [Saliniradius amylolyticus]|uniref:Type II secretion system protein n=1 Tax=Saliniradius amylolyticus TaxID=2183582 RepID=A0A2S2E0P2_9ALTE|nr:type II secretion system protein [Saliniradius amylolyticus]AWL11208.1 hypothetical protein HMF8227_00712 [Saliniradius amylolyticus]